MAQSEPPLLVGILGALFALQFPEVVFGVAAILCLVAAFRIASPSWKRFRQIASRKMDATDSALASWYYRNRARVLAWLGLIGRP